ncbi:MAG TPA: DUF58 domain-containing protein [Gaiellaceae bacterium]|nr:DUF58 domain-containing protein [Gaiellaceae bacterium]
MTNRGRAVLSLGLLVYVVAWIFGARALYPVACGLLFAVALAVAWVRLSARPPHVRRHGAARDVFEGDDVEIELEVELTAPLAPPTLVALETPGRLGERSVVLERAGRRRFGASYALQQVPRGRYAFESVRLTVEDPFGLVRADLVEGERQALVVYPRLVELDRLFSAGGAHAQEGRRLLLRRPTGFDLHSVREHQRGESLRAVHWRSTARRGQLMVKELEDAPRDEVVVLLDGVPEEFDVAVRAAGSILQSHVRRGRRCVLVVNSAAREVQPAGDWQRTLEVLAGAEPTATIPAFALLDADGGTAARALELVVVTARVDAPLVDRLVHRTLTRRGVSLVYIGDRDPQLLRVQAAGIPLAVVHPGDDLRAALSAAEARVA